MAGLTWLHLSDWHQAGADFNHNVVLDELLIDIRQRAAINPKLENVNAIIFSGDLAFNGKRQEYRDAKRYLFEPLLAVTGLTPDSLFCVPGNHDFNREAKELLPEPLTKPLYSGDLVQRWLVNERLRKRVLDPFTEYRRFISGYSHQMTPDYGSIKKFPLDGKQIALLGLNSAWMCARNKLDGDEFNDYGFLSIGEPQIHDPLLEIEAADIRIVVMHHPFDWLAEFEQFQIKSRLRQKCHFILTGHEHCPDIEISQGTHGNSIIIPAGACFDRRIVDDPRLVNAYNFVHIDLDTNQCLICLRRWDNDHTNWHADDDFYRDGIYSFKL